MTEEEVLERIKREKLAWEIDRLRNDRKEKFLTLGIMLLILSALIVCAFFMKMEKDKQGGNLTIVVPAGVSTPTPEVLEEPVSVWGTEPVVTEAMIRPTEPRVRPVRGLRTVPTSSPISTPRKASANPCLQDCQRTLRRLPLGGSAGAHPSSTEGGVGSFEGSGAFLGRDYLLAVAAPGTWNPLRAGDRQAPPTIRRASYQGRPAIPAPSSDIMEAPEPGPWMSFEVSAYGHACRCDRMETLPDGKVRCRQFKGPARRATNGRWPVDGVTVAGPKSMAFGTLVEIRHENRSFYRVVTDRGSDIGEGRLDLFYASCDDADKWGRRFGVQVRIRREPLGGMK